MYSLLLLMSHIIAVLTTSLRETSIVSRGLKSDRFSKFEILKDKETNYVIILYIISSALVSE